METEPGILIQARVIAEQAWKKWEGDGNMADCERLGSGMPRPYEIITDALVPTTDTDQRPTAIIVIEGLRIPVDYVAAPRPYANPGEIVAPATIDGRLPKATRTLTYAERYLLKEIGRGRIPGVESITSRAQIGRRGKT